ncbi:hypothetical protein CQW23_12814 [Capsicum baccatum]|uniref:Uncharacterized protein n=1 Tax=Capsicum baccatum TaxID=33114 RepID=A0A2G2WTM2_CAPBA|nr:hypothetical protein CQW23_12814 [Capsicum baccatum]
MLAQEIISGINKLVVSGNMVIKIAVAKAYDMVYWYYTFLVLRRFGFGEILIDILWRTLSNNWYFVLVNATRHGFFHSTRGLKQDDPPSPALFIFGDKVLLRALNTLHHHPQYYGFHMERHDPHINHLSFADDIIIFTTGIRQTLRLQMRILASYEEFLDGLSNGDDENHCFISCEDYLLDIELEEDTPTLHDVTRDISCVESVILENQLVDSVGRNCGIHVLTLSGASSSSDHDAMIIDNFDCMSTDKRLMVSREMLGHKTPVADNQWLKPHMIVGLENQEISEKNFSFPKCSLDSSENQGANVPPASCRNLLTVSTAFASIFTFRRKPRVQHVKRREHIQWNSFKCLSSVAGEIQLDCPDKWDSKESAEENVKCCGMKPGISEQCLKCKPSRRGFGRRYYRRGATVTSQGLGKRNFQVGFDQLIRRERQLSKDCKANRAHDDNIHSAEAQNDPSGTLSDQSSDDTSEDDWTIGCETRGTNKDRKHRKYWSTREVLKLVEGVSEYGVGRWNDIKKMFFQSSMRRSPVDLKDKWQNLLRASCRRLQSRRGVDAKMKRRMRSIPRTVLNHVRNLAVIYPYSRQRRSRISSTESLASSNVKSDNH